MSGCSVNGGSNPIYTTPDTVSVSKIDLAYYRRVVDNDNLLGQESSWREELRDLVTELEQLLGG